MIEAILALFSGGNGFYAIIAGLVGVVLFQARQSGKRVEREKQRKDDALLQELEEGIANEVTSEIKRIDNLDDNSVMHPDQYTR